MSATTTLRWERPDTWIYPRPLSLDEQQELHKREIMPFGFPPVYPFGIVPDPRIAALRAIHDAMESLPWVGRYMVENNRIEGTWAVRVEGLGRVALCRHLSLEEIRHMPHTALRDGLREILDHQYKTFVREYFAKMEVPA